MLPWLPQGNGGGRNEVRSNAEGTSPCYRTRRTCSNHKMHIKAGNKYLETIKEPVELLGEEKGIGRRPSSRLHFQPNHEIRLLLLHHYQIQSENNTHETIIKYITSEIALEVPVNALPVSGAQVLSVGRQHHAVVIKSYKNH